MALSIRLGAMFFKLVNFRQNFDLKKNDFNLYKISQDFPWKKLPKFTRFQEKEKEFQLPDFYAKFQYVAKNIE